MFCRTRSFRKVFFQLTFGCCIAIIYIQIQLLPDTKRNNLVGALTLRYDKIPPKQVLWAELCKPNNSNQEKTKFPSSNSTKKLNIFKWNDVKGYSINSLVKQPWFPWQPTSMSFASIAMVNMNSPHYGQWIMGYLHADITGEYMFALSSDDSSELWISKDENPENSQRVAMVTGWTKLGQHTKYFYQISDPVPLKMCKRYFIEILHKQSVGEGFVALSWKRPGYEKFFVVTGAYLSPMLPEIPADMTPSQITLNKENSKLQKALQRQSINKLSLEAIDEHSQLKRVKFSKQKRSLVACQVGLYTAGRHGSGAVAVYPMLPSKTNGDGKELKENLHVLSYKAAKGIVAKYLSLLDDFYPGTYSLVTVIAVERKQFPNLNERYMVDLVLRQHYKSRETSLIDADGKHVRVTDYLLKKWDDETICTPDELQWSSVTLIQVIVVMAEGEWKWAWQLIDNIEDIIFKTKDKNLHMTIVAYEQVDNLKRVLSKSSFTNYNVIRKSGGVNRVQNIQEAINSQPSSKRIVMVIDSHMKLSLDIMDQARKHCVENHMAFSPLAFHLNAGYSPAEPKGLWDARGFNLIAMFENDWKQCFSTLGDQLQNDTNLENIILSQIDIIRVKIQNLYYFKSQ